MQNKKVKWLPARKKPVIIHFREVEPLETFLPNGLDRKEEMKGEHIETREGTLIAIVDQDYIIRGIKGELYPIKKDIFNETYEVLRVCGLCKKQMTCDWINWEEKCDGFEEK